MLKYNNEKKLIQGCEPISASLYVNVKSTVLSVLLNPIRNTAIDGVVGQQHLDIFLVSA